MEEEEPCRLFEGRGREDESLTLVQAQISLYLVEDQLLSDAPSARQRTAVDLSIGPLGTDTLCPIRDLPLKAGRLGSHCSDPLLHLLPNPRHAQKGGSA